MIQEKKAQVSTEYLVLVGFLLVLITVLSSYALFSYSETNKTTQANNALIKLKNSAENIYAFGPGNKDVVKIFLPQGTTNSDVSGILISFDVNFAGGTETIYSYVDVNVSGTLPSTDGIHFIRLEVVGNQVVFSEG